MVVNIGDLKGFLKKQVLLQLLYNVSNIFLCVA